MYLGKKLYHSRALGSVKLISIIMGMILFLNLIFQTYNDPHFLKQIDQSLNGVFAFHWFYPQELFTYILTILIPCMYYGFIRGIKFFEKGVIFNRGLPFFNSTILYRDIEKYEVINPKYLISITEKHSGDEHMFGVGNVDRVIAILDQSGIPGDFGSSKKSDHLAKKKLILIIFIVGVVAALAQYFGFARYLFR